MRLFSTLLFCLLGSAAFAQEDPHAEDRKAMVQILREIEASINEQSVDRMLKQMDPGATVTWWNAEVSRGHADIKAYHERMMKLDGRILNKYTTVAKLGASARFLGNGDVAIADGTAEDEFFPVARGSFRMSSRWSTTLHKTNGEWKVVSLHLSSNVFNNSLLDEAKKALLFVGLGGLFTGLILGWVYAKVRQVFLRFFSKARSGV